MKRRILVVFLVAVLSLMCPLAAMADRNDAHTNNKWAIERQKEKLEEQKEVVEERLEELQEQLDELEEQLEEDENKDDKAKEYKDKIDDLKEQMEELENKIEDIEKEIDALEDLEEEDKDKDDKKDQKDKKDKDVDEDKNDKKDKDEKPWENVKDKLEEEKDQIEEEKDELEDQIEELKEQYEQAKEAGNVEEAEDLLATIKDLQEQKETLKYNMKLKIQQMKKVMKEKYTQEELDELEDIAEELEAQLKVKVIPVTHVFIRNAEIKIDTPPVIKQGRTLIPVRAISEATGATVDWDGVKQITIKKDDKEIILHLDSNKIYVNQAELEIDVPAQLINNRTVVPLRFIIENLELEVKWDGETETIDII